LQNQRAVFKIKAKSSKFKLSQRPAERQLQHLGRNLRQTKLIREMTAAANAAVNSSRERLAVRNPKAISITYRQQNLTNLVPTAELSPAPVHSGQI